VKSRRLNDQPVDENDMTAIWMFITLSLVRHSPPRTIQQALNQLRSNPVHDPLSPIPESKSGTMMSVPQMNLLPFDSGASRYRTEVQSGRSISQNMNCITIPSMPEVKSRTPFDIVEKLDPQGIELANSARIQLHESFRNIQMN
jgi:hypothetical protein